MRELRELRAFKVVFFDCDGTITKEISPWRYLHRRLGLSEKAKRYPEMFRKGEIDYVKWCRLDAKLWAGTNIETVRRILGEIPYFPNARETISTLKSYGMKLFLISNGLNLHTDQVKDELGFDYAISNELLTKNGKLTGDVVVRVPFNGKGRIVEDIILTEKLDRKSCVAIGNDESDVPMFKVVGFAIAFNPNSDRVRKNADVVIEGNDLSKILPYLSRSH